MQAATRRWVTGVALFVLVALGILYISPTIMRRQFRAKLERRLQQHVTLTSDIHVLRTELERYKAASGRYPTTGEGLRVLPARPKDPWGHDYIYRSPGIPHGDPYDVFSAGPDGNPNTIDDDWGD